MPAISETRIGVALDMRGCPNRCRHCWLGVGTRRSLSEQDLRWTAEQFRRAVQHGRSTTQPLTVYSWFREPDYADDYRRLHELEGELSDGKPERFELLSIWRLARDPSYAAWARSAGPDTCQISFFGMEATTDWFYRRRGAFRDALTATERLLEVGMKPRWQLFLTTKLIPELADLLRLIDRLRLRERVAALGGEFQLFMHTPGPDGEGRRIEHLRPTVDQVQSLPAEVIESSRKHFGRDTLWHTEADLVSQILSQRSWAPEAPPILCFFVLDNWDVHPNVGTLEPWWRLGNLKQEPVKMIVGRFERDETLGLQTLYHYPAGKLAQEYGDPAGQKIYSGLEDILMLYLARHCERMWKAGASSSFSSSSWSE